MAVITIDRQYGAGGETVGHMVADAIGAELVDSKIWEAVARRLDLPPDEAQDREEKPTSFLDRVLVALGTASPELMTPPESAFSTPYVELAADTREAVLVVTQEVIRGAAASGNAVIVGRGSAYLLAGIEGAIHCFLRAHAEPRLKWLQETHGLTGDAARQRLKQVDSNRAAYIKQVYRKEWEHPSNYHMVLDTGRLGYRLAADLIVTVATRPS